MSGFLLDTNVVSELWRARPNENVLAVIREIDIEDVYISVVTVAEIITGYERLMRRDEKRAGKYEVALRDLVKTLGDRVLPIDQHVAETAGGMQADRPSPVNDTYLAATAALSRLVMVTRNVKDFDFEETYVAEYPGDRLVILLNPWDGLAALGEAKRAADVHDKFWSSIDVKPRAAR